MTVSLTPADAESKISQLESIREKAVGILRSMQGTQQGMVNQTWKGDSATRYSSTSDQQHEDFTQIINALNSVVETGSAHMRSIANMDNG